MTSPTIALEPPQFDWYQATVEMSGSDLVDLAVITLGDESPRLVPGKNGYGRGWEIRREGARAALVQEGGQHEWPHIVGTGADAGSVADLLRARNSSVGHRVARCDVRVDTDSPGAFGGLLEGLQSHAAAARAKGLTMTPDQEVEGRTYYVGSKNSEVRARLYEKGRQTPEAMRPAWVRYEVQCRPQKDRKTWAAQASERDLLGAAAWARAFAAEYLDTAAAAPPVRSKRVSDLEGALRTLTAHYSGRLLELVELHAGDMAAFGHELYLRALNGGLLVEAS